MTRQNLRIKRVYEPPDAADGVRVLVDRLWPRCLSRERAKIDLWLKDVAPSDALRREFHRDPSVWGRFKKAYTDLRKFLDRNVPFTSAPRFDSRHHYRADEAGAQATAQSERTRPLLVANRFHAISQASMMSAKLRNTELASQWLRR